MFWSVVSICVLLFLAFAGASRTNLSGGEKVFGLIVSVFVLILTIFFLQVFGSDSNSL
jgi:hypothetical protein